MEYDSEHVRMLCRGKDARVAKHLEVLEKLLKVWLVADEDTGVSVCAMSPFSGDHPLSPTG